YLVEIAAGRHGISEHQLDLLIRSNNEHRADCGIVCRSSPLGGSTSAGVNHVVEFGDLEVKVTDNRIVHRMALGFLDILGPFLVIGHGINAQTDHFKFAFRELRFETRHIAELSCANRGEILWMRKQNGPPVANPVMEINGSFRRLRGKIGSFFSDMERHIYLLSIVWIMTLRLALIDLLVNTLTSHSTE